MSLSYKWLHSNINLQKYKAVKWHVNNGNDRISGLIQMNKLYLKDERFGEKSGCVAGLEFVPSDLSDEPNLR